MKTTHETPLKLRPNTNRSIGRNTPTFNKQVTCIQPCAPDMFALCAVVLLVSVSQAAALSCEELVKPLDQLESRMTGTWGMIAGSLNAAESVEELKLRDSVTIQFSNSSDPITYTQVNRLGDYCYYMFFNVTIEGDTFTFPVMEGFKLTGTLLYTSCEDCAVVRWQVEGPAVIEHLYLLSRRREVDPSEMEEYKAQLECLGLPLPVEMNPTKKLCLDPFPEKKTTTETETETKVEVEVELETEIPAAEA